MARSTQKNIDRIIAEAEGHLWHDYRNLARFLSLALKFSRLGFIARSDNKGGTKARKQLVYALVRNIEDPSVAESKMHDVEMPRFERMTISDDVGTRQRKQQMMMRMVIRKMDGAFMDARTINEFTVRLLKAYDVNTQLCELARTLSEQKELDEDVSIEEMRSWYLWAGFHGYVFFSDGSHTLGDILADATRERNLDARVTKALADLDIAA